MATDSTADEQSADDNAALDPLALRVALSRFPTGVCIVTTLAPDGQAIGLTVNSFASVSLEPPLVLWSLRRNSACLPAFQSAPGFAINVLGADQLELSSRFARPGAEKFAGVRLASQDGEAPLIERAAAHFSCARWQEYDGGDHVIFIGKVLRFTASSAAPLAFVGGRYATVRARTDAPSVEDLWPIPVW